MLSDNVLIKIKQFMRSDVINMTTEEAREFKSYYQQKYRDNVNTSCGSCFASCIKKVIRDENIQA